MKISFLFITIFNFMVGYSQQRWTTLEKPQTNVLGSIIANGVLMGTPVDTSWIRTEIGSDEYISSTQNYFSGKFLSSSFGKLKYSNMKINNMKIDYLSDSALYNNDKYLNNYFIYKAIRADTIFFHFLKDIGTIVKPGDFIANGTIDSKVREIIPSFDSIAIEYQSSDSLVLSIINPRVYFQVIGTMLNKRPCFNCNYFFASSNSTKRKKRINDFVMDISNPTRSNQITVQHGNNSVFTLYVKQDVDDNKKLKLVLECNESFRRSNNFHIPQYLEIPYSEINIAGNVKRIFKVNKYFLGSIVGQDKKKLGSITTFDSKYLERPLYLYIDAEQINETSVLTQVKLSKIEYAEYYLEEYNRRIN